MGDRPTVSVVMPFAGEAAAAREAAGALRALDTRPGDELILADNSGTARRLELEEPGLLEGVIVVAAVGEHSPAHARNAGARRAQRDWILFLDADCRAPAGLLDAYFEDAIGERVGALAGQVVPAADARTLAARYGAARGFLDQRAHLAHPHLPRAVAANLLVRREAFEQVGGFFEGLRAAEDTDFSWRLQHAGWRLELCPGASVEHRYRATVSELRRQWRGYAAGRAWLARRYEDFVPQPALARAARRFGARLVHGPNGSGVARRRYEATGRTGRLDRGRYLAIDALLAGEELAGLMLSNRPAQAPERSPRAAQPPGDGGVQVVLVAERFPAAGDPLLDFARTLRGARVEAASRPEVVADGALDELRINYREDDGALLRLVSVTRLVLRHPLRCLADAAGRRSGEAPLSAIAPAVRRLERGPAARVQPLGGNHAQALARRLARLAGRALEP